MLYSEYMDKVKEFALIKNEKNGLAYIRPDVEYVLAHEDYNLGNVTDFENVSIEHVLRHLRLECDMLNAKENMTPVVARWLNDVISTVIEPAIIQEQNALIKDMLEYRKEKNAIDTRTLELDKKEQMLEEQSKILPMNFGMNFSKKKP